MALGMLAQAYEEEDSQTITSPLFVNDIDDKTDVSENDETVNEDTIIRRQSTYLDDLIHNKLTSPRISESMIFKQLSTTHSIPHNAFITPKHTYSYNSPHSKPTNWKLQPSEDSLVIFEHLQNQIDEKRKENDVMKLKLKQKITENINLSTINEDLKNEIKQIEDSNIVKQNEIESKLLLSTQESQFKTDEINQLNGRINDQNIMIQSLCKQIDQYENIIEWLQIAMSNDKVTVNTLEEWKQSMVNYDGRNMNTELEQKYDDEKENEMNEKIKKENVNIKSENVNEKEILIVKDKNKYNMKKGNNKYKKKLKRNSINNINIKAENEANDAQEACCYKYIWFLER